MSMQPSGPNEVPGQTARVARAAFPNGSLAIRVRDGLGPLFGDEGFVDLFPARGKPAWSPGRLALVLVLQFVEGLTDRQAAEAVRARIDWKYALGLELGDPGFDFSVLSEFRDRLTGADGGRRVLDGILAAAGERGLLTTAGRARTDSTHVLSAARELSWLEMVAESLRAALNALAQEAPQWLVQAAEPDWFRNYATRAEDSRFPKSRTKRDEVGARIGRDGMRLLEAVFSPGTYEGLRTLEQVEYLRQVWVQSFHLVEGEVRRRDPKDRPPGAMRLVTPYDSEARGSVKRDTVWDGYKVHLTETCEPDALNLITNVATTVATVPDISMTDAVHAQLAQVDRLPGEHLVDAGYVDAHLLVSTRREYGITLTGPVAGVISHQAAANNGFTADDFSVDWEGEQVTCPGGKTARCWNPDRSPEGTPVIRVRFSGGQCRPCPVREQCTTSSRGRRLTLRPREEHEALRQARAEQDTETWKDHYKTRAGVEGTISQAVGRCGLRRSRYRGLAKTSLQHQLTGAAINLARIDAYLTGTPRARTRTSRFAALGPAEPKLSGAE
ncbi:IS1182 family transposase [Streptomyces sp. DSM 42041]|uniref:IS1182 family transposase n=1 Tax=Streptomyces hazeniae TaxID=3075538 RepID=A0ABU2NXZ9_9ACTN|nr:IS1182 family transposase [Streptomyces sp. DSM 42041]MDT0381853.1 IS1182 family transposase [Streptomyces sp. DSM 42041]